jgi:hypothetical protein
MIGPVSTENSFQAPTAISTRFWASALWPFSISTLSAGPPIWAWRDSSVWMLEMRLAKVWSPASAASAARPRNCMLVKPVSKLKVSMMETLMASRVIMMSSKKWRAAIIAHSLVS